MGIVTAILGFLSAAFVAVTKAVTWLLQNPIALVLVVGIICGMVLTWKGCDGCGCGCRRRGPRPPRTWNLTVVSATTGASLVCSRGKRNERGRNRRLTTVRLSGVYAPAEGDPLFEKSRANLERLAGKTVRVVVPRRRAKVASDGAAERPDKDCPGCAGTGIYVIDGDIMVGACFAMLMDSHSVNCVRCKGAKTEEDLCEKVRAVLVRLQKKYENFESFEQECLCVKTAPLEELERARVLVGLVYGQSNALLNLEQVRAGMAKCLFEAPDEWKDAEKEAKEAKRGVWK